MPEVQPGDLFALMYTSGTTGRPKGAMRSHAGNALIALATALEFGLSRANPGCSSMPLCHANSLYFGVTFAMLGATIVVDDRDFETGGGAGAAGASASPHPRSCPRTT
jgi:acyl-CoA synthetase (AMP-forming)/AMP-acid ligase II